jgi:hypothetical protein
MKSLMSVFALMLTVFAVNASARPGLVRGGLHKPIIHGRIVGRPAPQDKDKNKVASYNEFLKAAKEAAKVMENVDECSLKVTPGKDGFTISNTVEGEQVSITIGAKDKIFVSGKTTPDGDYDNTYTVPGVGSFEIIHDDDGSDHIIIKNKEDKTSSYCDVEY